MIQGSSHVEITNEDNGHTFFNIKSIVPFEFIPRGQTITKLRTWK